MIYALVLTKSPLTHIVPLQWTSNYVTDIQMLYNCWLTTFKLCQLKDDDMCFCFLQFMWFAMVSKRWHFKSEI